MGGHAMGSFLGIFLLERCTADGVASTSGFTWFPHAMEIAQKEEEEEGRVTLICISSIPWGWVDTNCGRRQIYERRWDDGDKRWVERWFDESYKPPPPEPKT